MLSQSFRVSKNLLEPCVPWHLLLDLCLLGLYGPWSRKGGMDKEEEAVFTQFMTVKEETTSKASGKVFKLPVGSAVEWRAVREH